MPKVICSNYDCLYCDKDSYQCSKDILRASVWSNAELISFDAVVEYDGQFRLKALDGSKTYNFCSICKSRSEIIGNIYDVKELTDGKADG